MKSLKIVIILVIGIALIVGTFFAIKAYKRYRIAQGLSDFAKKKGVQLDAQILNNELKKLSNREFNEIIKFSNYLKDNRPVLAIAMVPQLMPILLKTNLIKLVETANPMNV